MTITGQHQRDEVRAPSYDVNAEKIILGILMNTPADQAAQAIDEAVDIVTPEDFYNPRTADLYRHIIASHNAGNPIGQVALAGWLADKGELARVGDATFLHDCVALAPLRATLGHYAKRVKNLAEKRDWETTGIKISQAASKPGLNVDDIAELAQNLLTRNNSRSNDMSLVHIGTLVDPGINAIQNRKNGPTGVSTGFADLDLLFAGGLRPGELTAVSGATSSGKTVFLGDVARHVTMKLGLTVAWFTLEMKKQEIFDRQLAATARVALHRIKLGELSDDDWDRVAAKSGPLSEAPIWICDESGMTVSAMIRQLQRLKNRGVTPDLVIVDHMHIVRPENPRDEEPAALKQISWDLKDKMAMGLGVPVLSGAQLNRGYAGRANKMPEISDLRSSSSIEQNCDNVILIHRQDQYDKESPRAGEADFIVAKSRNGPTDTVTVAAQLHLARFVDMAIV